MLKGVQEVCKGSDVAGTLKALRALLVRNLMDANSRNDGSRESVRLQQLRSEAMTGVIRDVDMLIKGIEDAKEDARTAAECS